MLNTIQDVTQQEMMEQMEVVDIWNQGSHSFTDKKIPGLFQDFPGPP